MEQDHNNMRASSSRHSVVEKDGSARVSLSMNHSPLRSFMRSSSLDRRDNRRSWRPSSIILSNTRPTDALAGAVVHHSGNIVDGGVRQDSLGRTNSIGSWCKGSISLRLDARDGTAESVTLPPEIVDKTYSLVSGSKEIVDTVDSLLAQIGCKGSRDLGVKGDADELLTLSDDALLMLLGSQSNERSFQSPLTPLTEEIVSVLPTDAILSSKENNNMESLSVKEKEHKLPVWLDLFCYLNYLAVFGILGVLTRYSLQKLFGPNHFALTGNYSPAYLDLPSNMIGSFLMGWFGVVFKEDIHRVSNHLLVGLTTGYLGSLTTFSGWNQKMLDLSSKGKWVYAVTGITFGMFVVYYSIVFGVDCANKFRNAILKWFSRSSVYTKFELKVRRMENHVWFLTSVIVLLLLWCLLWALSGAFFRNKFSSLSNGASLWLAFLVGPPGVWIRWRMARLNGQGLGRKKMLRWLPIGTLFANILAACLMAALSTIDKAVDSKRGTLIISGLQLGFLGCLSTVSTFVAEIYGLGKAGYSFRAFVYCATTIVLSFALGTLIYSVPVWTKHYT